MTRHPDRLIVHLGPPKSATTALQAVFREQSQSLASAGVLYPESGRYGDGHWRLARALLALDGEDRTLPGERPPVSAVEEVRTVRREFRASGCRDLLLSSEMLVGLRAPMVDLLLDELDPERVIVVAGLRPPREHLASVWAQEVLYGGTTSLRKTTEDMLADRSADLFPSVYLQPWLAVGAGLCLVQVGGAGADWPDLLSQLAELWGGALEAGTLLRANVSLDSAGVESMRHFNIDAARLLAALSLDPDASEAVRLALTQFRRLAPASTWAQSAPPETASSAALASWVRELLAVSDELQRASVSDDARQRLTRFLQECEAHLESASHPPAVSCRHVDTSTVGTYDPLLRPLLFGVLQTRDSHLGRYQEGLLRQCLAEAGPSL